MFTNSGPGACASQRPPAGTGRDRTRILSHGRSERTRLLAEGQGGWLLVGTGFRRGTGAYPLHRPPERVLGGRSGRRSSWVWVSALVGCSRVQGAVSVEADPVQNRLHLGDASACGRLPRESPATFYYPCFSIVIRELQFDKNSLDLFQTEMTLASDLAF